MPRRPLLLCTTALLATLALGACSSDGGPAAWAPSQAPQATGTLGAGFWNPSQPPTAEATITPSPGSWDDVRPKPGFRVALVIDGVPSAADPQVKVLRNAIQSWAGSVAAHVTEFTARKVPDYVLDIQAAIDAKPDLVISIGDGLADPMALVTATNLETQFLIVGAEIAEPTSNVTAADWVGASFRGEGLGLPETYDPASFTPERAGRAVRAGVAAVLSGLTGIVVQVG